MLFNTAIGKRICKVMSSMQQEKVSPVLVPAACSVLAATSAPDEAAPLALARSLSSTSAFVMASSVPYFASTTTSPPCTHANIFGAITTI